MSVVKQAHKALLDAYIEGDSREKRDLQENFDSMVDSEISNAQIRGVAIGFISSIIITLAILSILEII